MIRLCVVASSLAALASASDVTGRVYDPSAAAVPGAQVILRSAAIGFESKSASGPAGEFQFAGLAAGTYEMEVLAPGFMPFRRRAIRIAERDIIVNATLDLGRIQETMLVQAAGQARTQSSAAVTPQRIRVGGNVQPAKLLTQVRAAYPEQARTEGREGDVTMQAVIGVDGSIVNVRALPGSDKELAVAAEAALRQWRYEPTRLNGQPVETVITVEISFRLGGA